MSCKDKQKFKTSEASSKSSLRSKGAIDKFLNILNVNVFNKLNKEWTEDAITRFGIEGKLFYNDNDKAVANKIAFKKIDNAKGINYQNTQSVSDQGIIASEKTIRDLAAKIADRIGMSVRFESDRSKQYKGKIENNVAYINLAYATLDTPIHEILGHPIIRALKGEIKTPYFKYDVEELPNDGKNYPGKYQIKYSEDMESADIDFFDTKEELDNFIKDKTKSYNTKKSNQLYQNLLKELEYGQGKEVLDRIKRDYVNKETKISIYTTPEIAPGVFMPSAKTGEEITVSKYTLEEQEEEAIVELLGLMTAEKLDNVKDGKLISLLKRLLKEMKQFIRSLINQKEVEIDKLPDNMTLGDLSDLLAYSNSKLILPGYEVEYTTPDNNKFKTYQEASNHISELAKSVEDVDLSKIDLKDKNKITSIEEITVDNFAGVFEDFIKINGKWYNQFTFDPTHDYSKDEIVPNNQIIAQWNSRFDDVNEYSITKAGLEGFIEKNKEYEQSKEIIEEWKKVNNIQYNPEEIYSRGQEFSSVVGAYSNFDVDLMMQNLLSHIEDNEKAGGKFAISAYTKPVDKQIGHLEGGGGKIKFKLYPQSNDILWAANTDVYSGSVWDASEKVNKDKKSELLGVSYTKYPSLKSINTVQPNLADIVDNLNHHHNELGIVLTGNNFRLEYDEDIHYTTKKIINGINKILDQKYGKLVKPENQSNQELSLFESFKQIEDKLPNLIDTRYVKYKKENNKWYRLTSTEEYNNKPFVEMNLSPESSYHLNEILAVAKDKLNIIPEKYKNKVIQPTQTNETLKESIESVKNSKNIHKNNNDKLLRLKEILIDLDNIEILKFNRTKIPYEKYDKVVSIGEIIAYEQKGKFFYVDLEKENAEHIQISKKEFEEEFVKYADSKEIKIKDYYYISDPDQKFNFYQRFDTKGQAENFVKNQKEITNKELKSLEISNAKEYTSQALINTKIAALKEVAKKQPRSLIRSEVKPINRFNTKSYEQFDDVDDLPFQKISSVKSLESKKNLKELETSKTNIFGKSIPFKTEEQIRYDYSEEIKQTIFNGNISNISAKQALYNILDSGMFDKNSKEYEMIHRMIISTKATIKLVDSKNMKSTDTYMQYNTVDNTIEMSVDNLGDVSSVKEGVEKFLHEVFHDRTLRILRLPKNITEQKLHDDLNKIYLSLKPLLEGKFSHEMSSLEEFTAGMFSNKEFEFEVEQLINTKTSFWNILKDFFKNLFGLSKDYDVLIDQLLRLIDTTDENYVGEDTLEAKIFNKRPPIVKKGLEVVIYNIEKTLEDLEKTTARHGSSESYTKLLKSTQKEINDLLDLYEKNSNEYIVESMKIFNNFMNQQLSRTEFRLDNIKDFNSKLYEQMTTYNRMFMSMQNEIKLSLKDMLNQNLISKENYLKIFDNTSENTTLSHDLNIKLKIAAKEKLKSLDVFSDQVKIIYLEYSDKYRKEGKQKGLVKNELEEYVNKQMSENRDLIKQDTQEYWVNLLENPLLDVSATAALVNTEKALLSPIIRIVSRILDGVKHTYTSIVQPKLLEIQSETNKFLEGKSFQSSDKNYENLVEWSEDGVGYIKGEYKIGFRESFIKLMTEVNAEDFGKDLSDVEKIKLKKSTLKIWFKENTTRVKNGVDDVGNIQYITKPADKWKTDFLQMSQKDIDYLNFVRKGFAEANSNYGITVKSLKKTTLGVDYYQLPSQHKELTTHLKNGNMMQMAKEIYEDTFKLRTDDTTLGELSETVDNKAAYVVYTDISGKEIKYVPIHHRGKIDKKDQSIDIPTLLSLEIQNSVKFKEKTKVHNDIKMFVDVIEENGYMETVGIGNKIVSRISGKNEITPEIKYGKSNTIKVLETMMNNRIYDKTSTNVQGTSAVDVSKIEGFVRGIVSRAGMALKVVGAPVNVISGNANTFFQVIKDPNLNVGNVGNAASYFTKHFNATLADTGRNVYKSLPNQILMQFGALVSADLLQNTFEKNKTLNIVNPKAIFFMQEAGEHWNQALHTLTILDATKILDKNGNYLDKNGNITSKDNAVSLLDIQVLENGNLTTTLKTPFYTTMDRMKEYNKGGDATIRSYVQSSLIKSQGQYSVEYQSQFQRMLIGKMISHFKKHILDPGLDRFRGLGTNLVGNEDDMIFNYDEDLQRIDEGSYVTFLRWLFRTVLPKIGILKNYMITNEWSEMDDWEKGNIKRTFAELGFVMLAATTAALSAGAASDDDDDNSFFWWAAATSRRVQSNALQFVDPNEAWRVLKNPVSSLRFLEDSSKFIGTMTNYLNPFEEDRNEKFIKQATKMKDNWVPGAKLFNENYKQQYNYMNK